MQSAVELSPSGLGPNPRRSAAGGVYDGSLYVFGGVDENSNHFDDIWRLSLEDESWTLLSKGDIPPIRLPGVSRIDETFYLFGGRSGDEEFFNQLWAFDDRGLRRLEIDGKVPEERYGHAQIAIDGEIYVFGGLRKTNGNHKLFDDLWQLNPETRRWSLISREGPSPRYGAAMSGWQDELVVFGGRYLDKEWRFSNATWIFDFRDRNWTRLDTPTRPSSRYVPGVVSDSDSMYVFGGMESRYTPLDTPLLRRINRFLTSLPIRNNVFPTFKPNLFFSDLWRFDWEDRSWNLLASDVGVPPLKTPLLGIDGRSIVIGFGNNLENHHGNVWRLTIAER